MEKTSKRRAAKPRVAPKGARRAAASRELISVVTKGGQRIPILGTATEGKVTPEDFNRLRRIKFNGVTYVERKEAADGR